MGIYWIYLSPHLDDAVLSCGGLIWEQVQAGDAVGIWTFCAGDPPPGGFSAFATSLHARWGLDAHAPGWRRLEDRRASAILGAGWKHFSASDCIYRRSLSSGAPLYPSEAAIFGELAQEESILVDRLRDELARELPAEARLVSPLAIGNHVDHQLTRSVLERVGRPLWYYADYPYLLDLPLQPIEAAIASTEGGLEAAHFPVSREGLDAWTNSVAAYRSQIPVFWDGISAMRGAIRAYLESSDGLWLWRAKE